MCAGTLAGGIKAKKTNIELYGKDYYRKLGSLGGRKSGIPKGFALMDPEKRKEAGHKGGRNGTRKGVKTGQGKTREYYYNGDDVFAGVEDV